jgi:hypothetical protein
MYNLLSDGLMSESAIDVCQCFCHVCKVETLCVHCFWWAMRHEHGRRCGARVDGCARRGHATSHWTESSALLGVSWQRMQRVHERVGCAMKG